MSTLYERLGGTPALEAVTAEFYRRVLGDDLLAPHFRGADMTRLTVMLAAFLGAAFGGDGGYTGRDLRTAHAGLDIGGEHFDRVLEILAAVLDVAGASGDDIAEAARIAGSVRGLVLAGGT